MELTAEGKHQALSFFANGNADVSLQEGTTYVGANPVIKKWTVDMRLKFDSYEERDRIFKLIEEANKIK